MIAFFLAAMMVCSTFGSASVTAYASGSTEPVAVVEETTATESSEMVSEEGEEAVSEEISEEESMISSEEAADESEEASETITTVETVAEETTVIETETVVEETAVAETVVVEETTEVVIETIAEDVSADLAYTGSVDEEDGTGLVLNIDAWQMDENEMTVSDETIISILEAQTQKVNVVSLNMSSITDSISAGVWNAALAVLTEEADVYKAIRYNQSGDTTTDVNWSFDNPQTTESAVAIGLEWSAGAEGEGITVSFTNTTFPADVWFNLCNDENKSDYAAFTAAMGDGTQAKLYTTGEGAEEVNIEGTGAGINRYTFEEGEDENKVTKNGINVSIGNIANLTADTSYVVKTAAYAGNEYEWEDGTKILEIANWDAGKDTFTKDEIINILANYETGSFNQIRVSQAYAWEVTFDGSLLNAMAAYIKKPGMYETNMVVFDYRGDEEAIAWDFVNPDGKATETANTVSTALTVSGNGVTVSKTGTLDMGGYQSLDIEYLIQNGSEKGQAVQGVLGTDAKVYELIGPDSESSGIEASYRIDGEETIVSIGGAQNMVSGTEYTLEELSFRGRVEGNVLFIEPWNFERYGQTFSNEAVVEIIKSYGDTKFGRIEVGIMDEPDEDPNMARLNKDVYNAAMAQLDLDLEVSDGLGKGFKYIYYEADRAVVWNFVGGASLAEDVSAGYWIGVNDEGNVQMTVSVPEIAEGIVNLEVVLNPGQLTGDMMERLGDGTDGRAWSLYPVENQQIYFNWNRYGENDDRMEIIINNINSLKNDTPYEVNNAEPAEIREEEIDGQQVTYLEFFAYRLGKKYLTEGDVAKYLKVYTGQTFDMVTVQQGVVPDTPGAVNKIYKSDYNYLLSFLKEDSDYRNLEYVFDQSYDEEGDWHQDQMRWNFPNPTALTKDLDMSFMFDPLGTTGQGIEITMPANAWPSSGVIVEYMYDARTYNGEGIRNAFDGWSAEDEEGNGYKKLIVLKDPAKLTHVTTNSSYNKFRTEEGKNIHTFRIEEAQNLSTAKAAGTYLLAPVNYYNGTYSVAQKYELNVTGTPDGAVTWKSYIPDVATISADGVMETNEEGELFYGAAYKENGIQKVEIWSAIVIKEIISMKFAKASMANPMEIELPPANEEWEAREYLDLRFYPTGIYAEPDMLEWAINGQTVSGNTVSGSCIEFLTDEQGNIYGEFKAVKAGEAVVTVTLKDNPNVSAQAKVIVKKAVIDEVDFENIRLLGIINYDKTLADIELPEGYAWKDPKTSLAPFANEWGYDFPAIYTSPIDGRTCEFHFPVQLFTFTEGEIAAWLNGEDNPIGNEALLRNQDKVYLRYIAGLENGPQNIEELNNVVLAETGRTDIRFEVKASSNPKNLLVESDTEFASHVFTADSAAKGKKTFTFALNVVDTKTNKAKTLAKKTFAVTVLSKPVINWADEAVKAYRKIGEETFAWNQMAAVGEKGTLIIEQPKSNYFKLTAKTLDAATCKIGTPQVSEATVSGNEIVSTAISYEVKQGGRVYIQLTAADEIKSKCTIRFDAEDIMPKAESQAVTIDNTRKDVTASVKWQLAENTSVITDAGLSYTIKGKANSDFVLSVADEANGKATIQITLANRSLKKGKYKLEVSAPLKNTSDSSIYAEPFKTTITVNVTSPKNAVTVKQTKKVNLFYQDYCKSVSDNNYHKMNGEFDILPKGKFTITNVELVDQGTKLCDYRVVGIGNDCYEIILENNGNPKNAKGILKVTTAELAAPIEAKVSIKTENKMPAYVLNSKSVTMYPNYSREGENTAYVSVYDKNTYECPSNFTLQVKTKDGWMDLVQTTDYEDIKDNLCEINNNTYNINVFDYGDINITLNTAKKATDKLEFRIKEADWPAEKVGKLTYTVKVDTSVPKLVLSSKTITLNSHKDIFRSQVGWTEFFLKNSDRYLGEGYWVSIVGVDDKSKKAKNENINIYCDGVAIQADINDNDIADGSYKYKVTLHSDGLPDISTNLTIKVKATDPSKCQTVKAKGSIDVLNRDGSGIVYTTKLKNVYGVLKPKFDEYDYSSYLTGPDAGYFNWIVEDGQMIVTAKDDVYLNTKNTYRVTPVFVYYNWMNDSTFEIKGKEQKIKVKQGKPKVTITTVDGSDNVLYRDRSGELKLSFNALLNKTTDVTISDVTLANYSGDLDSIFNDEDQTLTLYQYDVNQIIASGKTWKLKFNVEFRDKAGNEKLTQVSYKVVIK